MTEPAIAAFKLSMRLCNGTAVTTDAAFRALRLGPLASDPMTSAVGSVQSTSEYGVRAAPSATHTDRPRSCTIACMLSHVAFITIGTRNCAPMPARSAFRPHASEQFVVKIAPCTPAPAAALRRVPIFPGLLISSHIKSSVAAPGIDNCGRSSTATAPCEVSYKHISRYTPYIVRCHQLSCGPEAHLLVYLTRSTNSGTQLVMGTYLGCNRIRNGVYHLFRNQASSWPTPMYNIAQPIIVRLFNSFPRIEQIMERKTSVERVGDEAMSFNQNLLRAIPMSTPEQSTCSLYARIRETLQWHTCSRYECSIHPPPLYCLQQRHRRRKCGGMCK